jgi:hypothetical protein
MLFLLAGSVRAWRGSLAELLLALRTELHLRK